MTMIKPYLGSLNWIDFTTERPPWGVKVLVYRGNYAHADREPFCNTPPVYDITERFDSGITHWAWLVEPCEQDGSQKT